MGVVSHIINLYGISNFITDIDRGREYWRDGDHLVSSVLDYAMEGGFAKLFEEVDVDYKSCALEFRQRYILNALKRTF